MGSGRGKSRRTQAAGAQKPKSMCEAWEEFVFTQGLGVESLPEYYLDSPTYPLDDAATQKLLNELFADLKEFGVVQFRVPINAENVEVFLGSNYGTPTWVLHERGRAGAANIFASAEHASIGLSKATAMSSHTAFGLVEALDRAAQELQEQWEDSEAIMGKPPYAYAAEKDGVFPWA